MTLTELRQLLTDHDWYFEFSDDHAAWAKGQTERALLAQALAEYPEPEYVALVAEYAPKDPTLRDITEDTLRAVRFELKQKALRAKGDV